MNLGKEDVVTSNKACAKKYPKVGKQGFGYMFIFLCPLHRNVYDGHMIADKKGRKDLFSSLNKVCEIYLDFFFMTMSVGLHSTV